MSQESIPPSDDEIFISTQIQGKLDDIEEETRTKDISVFLQQFANKTPKPSFKANNIDNSVSSKQKPKSKSKPKKKAKKKLSVTDQMIRKLSGKPQKLRQMHLKQNIRAGDLRSRTPSFEKGDEDSYASVFTSNEWNKMKYTFNIGTLFQFADKNHLVGQTQTSQTERLWDAASDYPDLSLDCWSGLYGSQGCCNATNIEAECIPPITFSQAYESSQRNIDVYKDEVKKNLDVDKSTNDFENLEPQFYSETSFGDEVVCSSDEGSIIEVKTQHRDTDDSPIALSASDLDSTDVYPTPAPSAEIKYKGSLRITQESGNRIRTKVPSQDEIPNTSDEEGEITNFIQIIRHERKRGLQVPSSPGYESDNEND